MNDIVETKIEDIGNRIGICRQTASKYLKQFVESGLLIKGKSGFYKCQYLAKEVPIVSEPKEVPMIIL
jgi:predicted transcriptional regulator